MQGGQDVCLSRIVRAGCAHCRKFVPDGAEGLDDAGRLFSFSLAAVGSRVACLVVRVRKVAEHSCSVRWFAWCAWWWWVSLLLGWRTCRFFARCAVLCFARMAGWLWATITHDNSVL